MTQYDNRGQVSLWKPRTNNPKGPAARGTVIAHRDIKEGEELDIALWRNDSDNPNAPLMKGKMSDRLAARQSAPSPNPTPMGNEFDEDIPF